MSNIESPRSFIPNRGTGYSQNLGWLAIKQVIQVRFPSVKHISTDSLVAWLDQSEVEKPLLLDARTEPEYAVSHLPGAQLVTPDTQDFAFLDPLAPSVPIVTYCSVGYRSSAMAHRLQEAGYTNVVNLEGSIFQWANEGQPVYRSGQRVQQVHPYNQLWGCLLDRWHAYEPT